MYCKYFHVECISDNFKYKTYIISQTLENFYLNKNLKGNAWATLDLASHHPIPPLLPRK